MQCRWREMKAMQMERDVDADKFHRVSDYILPSFCSGEIFLSLFVIVGLFGLEYTVGLTYINHF
jgi:hypothetical protein